MVKSLRRNPVVKRTRKMKKSTMMKKTKVSKTIKAYVSKAISRRQENKLAQPYTFNNTQILPYGENGNLVSTIINLNQVFINVTGGTAQGQRIGNEIHVKRFTFKGFINRPYVASAVTNTQANDPMYLKMVIGRQKSTLAIPTDFSNLLQNGATTATPNNLPSDMYRYLNKDYYQIMTTRFFKLGLASAVSGTNGGTNNDFKVASFFSIDLTKHIHKVKYDDAGTTPTNCAFFAWFLLCNADGTAMTLGASPIVQLYPVSEIHGDVSIQYEDA